MQGFVQVRQGPRGVTRTSSVVQGDGSGELQTVSMGVTSQPKQWTKEEVCLLRAVLCCINFEACFLFLFGLP